MSKHDRCIGEKMSTKKIGKECSQKGLTVYLISIVNLQII